MLQRRSSKEAESRRWCRFIFILENFVIGIILSLEAVDEALGAARLHSYAVSIVLTTRVLWKQ